MAGRGAGFASAWSKSEIKSPPLLYREEQSSMKKLIAGVLVAAWLIGVATPSAASATETYTIPMTACAIIGVPDEDCDPYDIDIDFEIDDDGDINIDITICPLKEKRTTITTVVVETEDGTEITTETTVECDYGDRESEEQ